MKYVYPFNEAKTIQKFGVDISIFGADTSSGFVYEETEVGHFEEFYDTTSTYTWFIIEGNGTFVIDDEKVIAAAKDLVVVPPNKRIHYFGKMKMLLCTTPAFDPANERHVRDVDPAESPYKK
jgi:mannose-6-phosphate isomerase-like protein (cupin superfamily)